MTPDAVVFVAERALPVAWLAQIILRGDFAPIDVFVNVTRCEPVAGHHVITAQPFALGGPIKAAWQALVASVRQRT